MTELSNEEYIFCLVLLGDIWRYSPPLLVWVSRREMNLWSWCCKNILWRGVFMPWINLDFLLIIGYFPKHIFSWSSELEISKMPRRKRMWIFTLFVVVFVGVVYLTNSASRKDLAVSWNIFYYQFSIPLVSECMWVNKCWKITVM